MVFPDVRFIGRDKKSPNRRRLKMNPVNAARQRKPRRVHSRWQQEDAEKTQIEEVSPRTGGEHGIDILFQQPGK